MMRYRAILAALALSLLCGSVSWAHSLTYEVATGPLFSFSLPAGWTFRVDGKRLVAAPADGAQWFGAWELEREDLPDEATDKVVAYMEAYLQDVKIDGTSKDPLNGMNARRLNGTGVFNGNPVRFSVVLFEPRPKAVCAAVGVWDDHEKLKEGVVEATLGSLRPAPTMAAGR